MEGNGKVICGRAFGKIDRNNTKIDREVNSSLQDNLTAETQQHVVMPKRRGRPRKRPLETNPPSPVKKTFDDSMIDYESALRKDRFRPIRPKPISSAAAVSKNDSLEMSSTLNTPTLMPNRFIFTTSMLDKNKAQRISTLNSLEKRSNYVKLDDDDTYMENVKLAIEERNIYENAADRNSNIITINNSLRNAKSALNSPKGSIELFFESMAQTVLNLPMEVQADIKMQICKIVTNAEVKYCGLQSRYKD